MEIRGPIEMQVTGACALVARNMRRRRGDVPQSDMTAVFEAIVNAVVHRAYSIYGAPILIPWSSSSALASR